MAQRIFERVMQLHGDDVLAIGLYGSMARNTDGPFSDVEMLCVLRSAGVDENAEWSAGNWKAEVNFRSHDVVWDRAGELDGEWSVSHGKYIDMQPLRDCESFLVQLKARVFAHTDEDFHECMREVIIGDMYELVGKWRNQQAARVFHYVPAIAFKLAEQCAWVIGLANRHLYTTGSLMYAESLALPDRPAGYDTLCNTMMRGELSDAQQVIEMCEACWAGVVAWAQAKGIELVTDPLNLKT
jgi:kanamycin nucleotidyltransferase